MKIEIDLDLLRTLVGYAESRAEDLEEIVEFEPDTDTPLSKDTAAAARKAREAVERGRALTDSVRLQITDDGLNRPETYTLAEFLAANADDQDVCDAVGALCVGESVRFGGGAAPMFDVKRVA